MKISPLPSSANTVGAMGAGSADAPRIQTPRTLRMNTNATPDREEAQIEELPPAVTPPDPKLTNPDPNDPANASEETKPLSPQLAALRKQQRALQVKERELHAREEALKAASPAQGDVIDKARLKAEPLSVLLEAGVTYDQLTEAILANQNGGIDAKALREQILKDVTTDVEKRFTDREAQSEQAALREMEREASQLTASGDTYELVRETRSIPDVMKLIERTYRETGEVLAVTEALQLVEDELINESLKLAGTKKVQSKLAPAEPAQPPPQQQRPAMRTLTNRDTASVPLSRKARALAAFNGTLKK